MACGSHQRPEPWCPDCYDDRVLERETLRELVEEAESNRRQNRRDQQENERLNRRILGELKDANRRDQMRENYADLAASRERREREREARQAREEQRAERAHEVYEELPAPSPRFRLICGVICGLVVLMFSVSLVGAPWQWPGQLLLGLVIAVSTVLLRRRLGGTYLQRRVGAIDLTGWGLAAAGFLVAVLGGGLGAHAGGELTIIGGLWRLLLVLLAGAGSGFGAFRYARRSRWSA